MKNKVIEEDKKISKQGNNAEKCLLLGKTLGISRASLGISRVSLGISRASLGISHSLQGMSEGKQGN